MVTAYSFDNCGGSWHGGDHQCCASRQWECSRQQPCCDHRNYKPTHDYPLLLNDADSIGKPGLPFKKKTSPTEATPRTIPPKSFLAALASSLSALSSLSVLSGRFREAPPTRSEAEARPHCKLARISPADRLDPHLNFVTPISPVCTNSLCQILRAFPGKLHGLHCTHNALLPRKPRHVRWGPGFSLFRAVLRCLGRMGAYNPRCRTKNKVPVVRRISLSQSVPRPELRLESFARAERHHHCGSERTR